MGRATARVAPTHCLSIELRRGRRLPTVVPTDFRPLSWPPIGARPRNRLASSATGGASPISPTPRLHQPAYMRRAACPHAAVFTQKNKREATLPSCKDTKLLIRSHGLDDLDLTAIVGTALRAHSVRQMQRTALGACHQTGSRQLPHGAASLIASLLGYFSLRYCHVDTSLVLYCLSSEIIEELMRPPGAGAWPAQPGGDPPASCSGTSPG